MTKFLSMLKIEMLSMFGINKLIHQKGKKGKLIGFTILFIYVMIVAVGVSTAYSFVLAQVLVTMDALHLLVATMMAAGCVISLITTLSMASNILFAFSDYDVIMSLPIKTTTIIAARFSVLYCLNVVFMLLLLVPAFVVYSITAGFSIAVCISFILSLFFIPLIPIIAATLVSLCVSLIVSHFGLSNMMNMIFMSVVMLLSIGFAGWSSFSAGSMTHDAIANMARTMATQVYSMYPLAEMYTNGVCFGNWLSLIGFVAISAAAFAVFVYLISLKYKNICSMLKSKRATKSYKLTELKSTGCFNALYKKELKRYFSSAIYLFNTSFGAIMVAIAAIACVVVDIRGIAGVGEVIDLITPIIPMAVATMLGTVCTTACAITLEGKNFWILQSSPIPASYVYLSKIAVNLTVTIPILFISNILFIIGLKLDIITGIMLFATTIVFCIFSAVMGILVNIKSHRFDWKDDTTAIKQGLAPFIGVLLPMLLGGAFCVIVFMLPNILTTILIDCVLMAITFLLYKTAMRISLNKIN